MGETAGAPPLSALRGDLAATVSGLLRELDGLGRIVAETRAQIAALRAEQPDAFIPAATDELAAIVEHTASATHEILDTCEALETLSARLPAEGAEALQAATTRIYEACAFQDITGQRIAKVVAALQAIESRIARAREGIASVRAEAAEAPPPPQKEVLLNGPQLPGAGISQSDIDALFD